MQELEEDTIKEVESKKTPQEIEILKLEKAAQEIENYKENEINWLSDDFWDSWDKVKGHCKKLWDHKGVYEGNTPKWFFLAHSKDTIRGKPQLIDNVQKNIPLVRQAVKTIKKTDDGEKIPGGLDIQSFYFFDEKYDKRTDGFQKDTFALDFRLYRIIDDNAKEYYVFSQQELPSCVCELRGMIIPLDDLAEMGRNLKLKSVSKAFILKEFIPAVKILTKEQIITYTKERKISSDDWLNFLAYHPQGTYNLFPQESNLLRSSFLLSGKVDGYPLHIFIIGKAGTKKSMGHIETLAYKFNDSFPILEGGNSRIKGLTPSFKEKPANLGYLAKAERIGFIDELGKMVEFEMNKHDTQVKNVLGECNFLLEHKNRLVGSGNDNDVRVKADSKFLFVSNPISSKNTIYEHVGIIDPTTMSRMLIWVQDDEETRFLLSPESVSKLPPTPTQTYIPPKSKVIIIENRKIDIDIYMCWGKPNNFKVNSREEFLTLFDTCNSFVSELDNSRIDKLVGTITILAKEPMKSSVWKPRAEHHVRLLIDGLCKHRCLFVDYDPSFKANEKDYDLAERILIRMVKGWDTNLAPKEERR